MTIYYLLFGLLFLSLLNIHIFLGFPKLPPYPKLNPKFTFLLSHLVTSLSHIILSFLSFPSISLILFSLLLLLQTLNSLFCLLSHAQKSLSAFSAVSNTYLSWPALVPFLGFPTSQLHFFVSESQMLCYFLLFCCTWGMSAQSENAINLWHLTWYLSPFLKLFLCVDPAI